MCIDFGEVYCGHIRHMRLFILSTHFKKVTQNYITDFQKKDVNMVFISIDQHPIFLKQNVTLKEPNKMKLSLCLLPSVEKL